MRPEAAAAVHAAAELLPVSSSGHLRAVGGAGGLSDVAQHAVPLAVTLVAWRADVRAVLRRLDRRRVGMHVLAGALPTAAGLLAGDRSRRSLPGGMLAGAALLAGAERVAGRGTRSRWDAGPADGAWLGLAQVASLWPGVSRLGTTLAVARLRGFAPDEAPVLAREIGVPVTLGALAHEAARGGVEPGGAGEALAAVAGALLALPLARRVDRGAALAPFALERAAVALLLLRDSRADA